MPVSVDPRRTKSPRDLLLPSAVSAALVLLYHSALYLVPRFLSDSTPLVAMLPVSGVVMLAAMGVGRCLKRVVGIPSFAPAFVLFNIVFLWGVFIAAVTKAVHPLFSAAFHAECAFLIIGLYRIITGDPGIIVDASSEVSRHPNDLEFSTDETSYCSGMEFHLLIRIRQCSTCKANVRSFDHHCPAFGNCIGQKNHLLFLVLLIGFIVAESSYIISSNKYIILFLGANQSNVENLTHEQMLELLLHFLQNDVFGNLVISLMIFSLLQVTWQLMFLMWHLYCICWNIRTDEWINWKKYPEFQFSVQGHLGQSYTEIRFRNPYDKGFSSNIKEFFNAK